MRLLDLFAGIGGFSLAGHWMGWKTVAFVEKEPFCQKVLIKNFGAILTTENTENTDKPQIYGDIFGFSGKPFRGRVDVVTGGFPCQPFSAAGKRKGRADERHLFPEMLRVIREVQPLWVIAENVRGLLSIESGAVFAEVVASLEGEGFEVVTFCVPASAVEAPHERQRLWIIARNTEYAKHDGRIAGTLAGSNGETASKQPPWPDTTADSERANSITADPNGRPSRSGTFPEPAKETFIQFSPNDSNVADAENVGRFGREQIATRRQTAIKGNNRPAFTEPWIKAATRFCRMDDGISAELDFPRDNRVNRLKALGNSIIPQIAFEIFQAIEAAENEQRAKSDISGR
jgi:DNA (cytosine-5)-methyltransferase 1